MRNGELTKAKKVVAVYCSIRETGPFRHGMPRLPEKAAAKPAIPDLGSIVGFIKKIRAMGPTLPGQGRWRPLQSR